MIGLHNFDLRVDDTKLKEMTNKRINKPKIDKEWQEFFDSLPVMNCERELKKYIGSGSGE